MVYSKSVRKNVYVVLYIVIFVFVGFILDTVFFSEKDYANSDSDQAILTCAQVIHAPDFKTCTGTIEDTTTGTAIPTAILHLHVKSTSDGDQTYPLTSANALLQQEFTQPQDGSYKYCAYANGSPGAPSIISVFASAIGYDDSNSIDIPGTTVCPPGGTIKLTKKAAGSPLGYYCTIPNGAQLTDHNANSSCQQAPLDPEIAPHVTIVGSNVYATVDACTNNCKKVFYDKEIPGGACGIVGPDFWNTYVPAIEILAWSMDTCTATQQSGGNPPATAPPTNTPVPPTPTSTPLPPEPACTHNTGGECPSVDTALGVINVGAGGEVGNEGIVTSIMGVLLSISGGLALLLIIYAGYKLLTSGGNPDTVKGARDLLTAAIVGLLFIILALVVLQVIGVDILHIPGWTGV